MSQAAQWVSIAGAVVAILAAVRVLAGRPRSWVHQSFALGMLLFAARELALALAARAGSTGELALWLSAAQAPAVLLPGVWLVFSLGYGRAGARAFLVPWRPLIALAFGAPLACGLWAALTGGFHAGPPVWQLSGEWAVKMAWPGHVLNGSVLLGLAAVLANLELTFGAATGTKRWRLKFMVLGLALVFAVEVYALSQRLLFAAADSDLARVQACALLAAGALIVVSLWRSTELELDVLVTPRPAYESVSLLAIAAYLLATGVMPLVAGLAGLPYSLTLGSFLLFVTLVLTAVVLLSDRLKHRLRLLVNRAFGRPRYDYRKVWQELTERASAIESSDGLCSVIARAVSDIFGVADVSVWLHDEARTSLALGGLTALNTAAAAQVPGGERAMAGLIQLMAAEAEPMDLEAPDARASLEAEVRRALRIRYAVSLRAGRRFLGVVTLSGRASGVALTLEDRDLLKTLTEQAAASLLHLRLAERLLEAKEMEAFQTLSAFFVHDLKNLASRLSVTMQNLPAHYDDPEFRADMLRLIAGSVRKIDAMCGRLSPISRGVALDRSELDPNGVVRAALTGLEGGLRARVTSALEPLPRVAIDALELQKVLVNLVVNADEASVPGGPIRVKSELRRDFVVLSVEDEGSGMSEAFVASDLFRPFKTTKPRGLGIGLFHTKKIVEAHGGHIEVQSSLGAGTTFRVFLPLSTPAAPEGYTEAAP